MDDALDEFEIQHGISGREASPIFERSVRGCVEKAFKSLLETKNLYQKEDVDLASLDTALAKELPALSDSKYSDLHQEATMRPWRIATDHQGDDPMTADILRHAKVGAEPLGTPDEGRSLHFFAPGVQFPCKKCKGERTFEALHCSGEGGRFGSPYPRVRDEVREQVFLLYYRCVGCREFIHTILVLREGLRIHLCGVGPRRQLPARLQVRGKLQVIANDAHNAVLEGDVFAGFYHLRTLVEHHIKRKLSIPIKDQIRGDELVERYNDFLPKQLKEVIPSLASIHTELSGFLHSRSGCPDDFARIETSIGDHINALRTLDHYHKKSGY